MLALRTRLRKALCIVAAVMLLSCMGVALYLHWLFVFYPEHVVTGFMGSKEHRTVSKRHSDYDWYIDVAIASSQGDTLLGQHSFRPGYDPTVSLPKIPSPDISACKECWSYIEGRGHGQYGYLLAILNHDKTSLQMYEFFGD